MSRQSISNWVWLVAALIVVGIVQIVGSINRQAPPALDPTSARPNGALALNLWFGRIGYRVRRAATPSLDGTSWRSLNTVMLLAPEADPPATVRRALAGWVRRGGRLAIVGDGAASPALLTTFGFSTVPAPPAPLHVMQPLLAAPPLTHLAGSATAVLTSNSRGIEVAGTRYGPVVSRERLGHGVVWVISDPDLLTNAAIASGDNRRLALNLAGPARSRIGLDVITMPAGASPSSSSNWLTDTTWGAVVLFAIFLVLLYRGLAGRRMGPPIESPTASFRPAVEYVLSIAGLLRRGQKRAEALRPYQRSLRRRLERRGIVEAPVEAQALMEPRVDLTERDLVARAASIVAYETELGEKHG